MTSDGDKPSGSDGPPKRRRRRRRKPRDGGEPRTGAPRDGESRSTRSDGGAAGDGGEAPRRRRRRRREGGPREGGPRSESAQRQQGRGGRGERRDGARPERTDGARSDRTSDPRSERPEPRVAAKPAVPPPASLDDGWDIDDGWSLGDETARDSSAVAESTGSGPEGQAIPAPDVDMNYEDDAGLESISTKITWGDDSDAPTPDVTLSADLPANPPDDDPDPVFAELEDEDEDEDESRSSGERAGEGTRVGSVVGVKFATGGKIYLYDSGDGSFSRGQQVVVESERGVRIGTVAVDSVREHQPRSSMRKILRRPSSNDRHNLERNNERSHEALTRARDLVREQKLKVKVFRAEFALSGNKCTIYFSAENKVDSRQLAKSLAQQLHCRVDVRQTGVRDEAKMVGGIGSCGLELCCTTWLPSFVPVSIKNAKDQGLVLNPSRVSGQCGRLKCCLVYEQETYAAMRKGLPKLGKRVVTDDGEGRVVEVDVLRQRIRVNLGEGKFQVYTKDQVKPMFPSQQPKSARDQT